MRLPGAIRFGGVPMSPSAFVVAGLLVEVAHLVVEQEARAVDHDVRAEAAFERVRVRHRDCPVRSTIEKCVVSSCSVDAICVTMSLAELARWSTRATGRSTPRASWRSPSTSAWRSASSRSRDRRGSARDRGTRAASLRSRGATRAGDIAPSFARSKCSRMLSISIIVTPPLARRRHRDQLVAAIRAADRRAHSSLGTRRDRAWR